MYAINADILNVLVLLLFILLFGGLAVIRQERLSTRFALESLTIGGGIIGISIATGSPANPLFLLLALYVITMRVRWLADLGSALGGRRRFRQAFALYRLALKVWPDDVGRQVVLLNQGAMWIKAGELERARETLEPLVQGPAQLSPRHAAAGHYNLGVVYERLGEEARAAKEFNAAIEALPASLYAVGAQAALRRRRAAAASAPKTPSGEGLIPDNTPPSAPHEEK